LLNKQRKEVGEVIKTKNKRKRTNLRPIKKYHLTTKLLAGREKKGNMSMKIDKDKLAHIIREALDWHREVLGANGHSVFAVPEHCFESVVCRLVDEILELTKDENESR